MSSVDVDSKSNFPPMVDLQDETTADADKLNSEIFSILETKFLFGYDDRKLHQISEHPQIGAVPSNQRGKICVLSVDGGGGMGSILSGKTLSYLETALKAKSGDPDASISDYFDVAAGTGVGGIFAAMLFASDSRGRPIFRADDTWKLVAAESRKFSPPVRPRGNRRPGGLLKRVLSRGGGGAAALEKLLKEAFRDEKTRRSLTLKNTVKPVLIPCYDLSSAAPFLFSRADALETDSYDFHLWEVCLATAAQPGVSAPVCMKSIDGVTRCVGVDGGLVMSNPTAAAITHVLHNKQEFPFVRGVEDILVLSVGAFGQLSFDLEKIKKWTAEDWAGPLSQINYEGSAEMVDQAVAMAFGQNRSSNYVRIQGNGLSELGTEVETVMKLGDEMLRQKNVESVMFGGKRIGEESNMEKLDWFAEQLVLEHQRRRCCIAPTVAFKQPAAANLS